MRLSHLPTTSRRGVRHPSFHLLNWAYDFLQPPFLGNEYAHHAFVVAHFQPPEHRFPCASSFEGKLDGIEAERAIKELSQI